MNMKYAKKERLEWKWNENDTKSGRKPIWHGIRIEWDWKKTGYERNEDVIGKEWTQTENKRRKERKWNERGERMKWAWNRYEMSMKIRMVWGWSDNGMSMIEESDKDEIRKRRK